MDERWRCYADIRSPTQMHCLVPRLVGPDLVHVVFFGCLHYFEVDIVFSFFFFSSTNRLIRFRYLRIYAISFKNKFVAVYFGTLALLRLILSLASTFLRPMTLFGVPNLPIDTSNLCPTNIHLEFKLVPYVIATTFGEWSCLFRPLAYISDREKKPRSIRVPRRRLVCVSHCEHAQTFGGYSHHRRRSHYILPRYGCPADIYPAQFCSGGMVSFSPFILIIDSNTPG